MKNILLPLLIILINTMKSDEVSIYCPRNHFIQSSNQCKECPSDSTPSNGYCICESETQYFNIKEWKCKECSNNTMGVDSTKTSCKCENDTLYFNMDKGECSIIEYPPCSKSQYYDSDTHKCVMCQEGVSEGGFAEKCSCNLNQFWHTGLNPKRCYTCGTGTPSEDYLFCDCKDSSQFWNNNTFQCDYCPESSSKYSTDSNNKYATQCKCSDSDKIFNPKTATCDTCPENSVKKENSETVLAELCICTDTDQYFDIESFKCVSCPSNSDRESNSNGNECQCKREYVKNTYLGGRCIKCPEHSKYNITQKKCVCESGYVFNNNQFICEKCPEGASSDSEGNCVCQVGYLIEGSCKDCPEQAIYNNESKTCECENEEEYYNSTNNECISCNATSNNSVYAIKCEYCDGDEFSEGTYDYCDCKSNKYYWDSQNKYCVRYAGKAYSSEKYITKNIFFIALILCLI